MKVRNKNKQTNKNSKFAFPMQNYFEVCAKSTLFYNLFI